MQPRGNEYPTFGIQYVINQISPFLSLRVLKLIFVEICILTFSGRNMTQSFLMLIINCAMQWLCPPPQGILH